MSYWHSPTAQSLQWTQLEEGRKRTVASASLGHWGGAESLGGPFCRSELYELQLRGLSKDTVQGFCNDCCLSGGHCSKQRNGATEPWHLLDYQNSPPVVLGIGFQSTLSPNPRTNISELLYSSMTDPLLGFMTVEPVEAWSCHYLEGKTNPTPKHHSYINDSHRGQLWDFTELKNSWFSTTYWKIVKRPLHRNVVKYN